VSAWSDPDMPERNRELLAERGGWPAGAVEACRRLEREFPGWTVYWARESRIRGFESPEGYGAWRGDLWRRTRVYAPTPAELADQMRQAGPERQ
jgi:hypothetical protein